MQNGEPDGGPGLTSLFGRLTLVCSSLGHTTYFRCFSSSLNSGVPLFRSNSYIIISVDEITHPASRMRSSPTFQFHSAREPTASDAT